MGIECDFWSVVFYESEDWVIRIAADVKRKCLDEDGKTSLSISDLCLIKNIDLFKELLQGDVNMETAEQCFEDPEDRDEEKFRLVNEKLKHKDN